MGEDVASDVDRVALGYDADVNGDSNTTNHRTEEQSTAIESGSRSTTPTPDNTGGATNPEFGDDKSSTSRSSTPTPSDEMGNPESKSDA